jgi:hypothetical protein
MFYFSRPRTNYGRRITLLLSVRACLAARSRARRR